MGTTLTGTTPQDTYDSLIKVTDNGPLSGTLKKLTDGLGNDSSLSLSTAAASLSGTLAVTGNATFDTSTLVVDATNNLVGIGTATPTAGYSLSVVGAFSAAKGGAYVEVGEFDRSLMVLNHTNASVSANLFQVQKSGTGVFTLTSTGNVGIGTSAPTGKLTVRGEIDTIADTAGAGYGSRISNPFNGVNAYDLAFSNRTNTGTFTEVGRFLAGGGLTFNGDTAAANALDDYEEGTFTPNIAGSTSAGTASYTVQSGNYTKIGRQVSISIDLLWSSGTGTGSLRITGLPFTNISTPNAATIGYIDGITFTALNYATSYIPPSTTRIEFVGTPTGGGSVTDVSYDSEGRIIITATYFV